MNSPPDPGSPSSSTPSSSSPPPDENQFTQQTSSSGTGSHLVQLVTSFVGGSPTKRRLPPGSSFGAASNTRDAKSRRREDPRSSGSLWGEGKDGKRDKDELVDISLAEYLRKEIGDPFHESVIKNAI